MENKFFEDSTLVNQPALKTLQMTKLRPNVQNKSTRIDISSCAERGMPVIAAKSEQMGGMGHRMMQNLFLIRYAFINGYCFCFDADNFGSDADVYHLLLESVFPACTWIYPKRYLQETNLIELEERRNSRNLTDDNTERINWVFLPEELLWPQMEHDRMPRGNGDVLTFMDSFLRDNELLDQVIMPWYRKHKNISSAYRNCDKLISINGTRQDHACQNHIGDTRKVLTAAFHLRVGDLTLEDSPSYWRNLLKTVIAITDLEFGPDYSVEIYLLYFKAQHQQPDGTELRQILAQNVVGEWPSEFSMLPTSHHFLDKLCRDTDRIQCFWKEGTNLEESINLFVESDFVYVSGSSFSQVLSLFNRGIRLVAITKELRNENTVPFLRVSTSALSSLRCYYIDGTGKLFNEQYAYLRLRPPNHTI